MAEPASITTLKPAKRETLFQRFLTLLPGGVRRAAIKETLEGLADITSQPAMEGKLEALIALRDRVGNKIETHAHNAAKVAAIGFQVAAAGLLFAISAPLAGAFMKEMTSAIAASLRHGAYISLGVMAAGASVLAPAMKRLFSTPKTDTTVTKLITREAQKIVKVRPDLQQALPYEQRQRLSALFYWAMTYDPGADKLPAEETATKKPSNPKVQNG